MLPKSSLELQWKPHNVDLVKFVDWVKQIEPSCQGVTASDKLTLFFIEDISDEVTSVIEAKWAELDDPEHEMCKSYKSQVDRLAEKQAKKESAKAKLAAIGLDAEEVAALLG